MKLPMHSKRGSALLTTFGMMILLSLGVLVYVDRATQSLRYARRQSYEIQTTHLCEAGVQTILQNLWKTFKTSQKFTSLDTTCANSSNSAPTATVSGSVTGIGNYSAGVTMIQTPTGDAYTRIIRIRAVGWIDQNGNGHLSSNEPQKTVDVTVTFQLQRSQVFDYAYFVNNYGWMNGFDENSLVINGDMRANGNFDFTNGTPTVNGSVYACYNEKLSPVAAGIVNTQPVKWSTSTYSTNQNAGSGSPDNEARWRPAYNATTHGAKGTATYENNRDYVFDSDGSIVTGRLSGAVIGDSTGIDAWTRSSGSSAPVVSLIDPTSTKEVVMPDLSDLSTYTSQSNSYVDNRATFGNGTANPDSGKGAYLDVWNSSTNSYQHLATSGVVTGSAIAVGTDTHPILIHGPVTITQDLLIKGTIKGQGTLYTGRNIHIIGSIRYKNKPDFRGSVASTVDGANSADDLLGLAARGSVIMGNTTRFSGSTIGYMTPPFTKGRYDDQGNWIPPYDATSVDSSGFMKYQTVLGDTTMQNLAEGVNQIDAVIYTNFLGGGNLGTSGGNVILNGSIISRDEAMVIWSLPMTMNYDSRIRERSVSGTPLIDINLPRSPVMTRNAWKDRGFVYGTQN